eukprot:3107475-Amphidinium_carterae.1
MAVTMCIDGAAAVMPFSSPLRNKSSKIVAQHMVEVILWLHNSPKSCKLFTHGIHPTGILLTGR